MCTPPGVSLIKVSKFSTFLYRSLPLIPSFAAFSSVMDDVEADACKQVFQVICHFYHLKISAHVIICSVYQLRTLPFPLQDDENDLYTLDDAAAASFVHSSCPRSVSATLYPQDMLAIQEHVATEALLALKATKLRAAAAADRLVAIAASVAVFERVRAAVMHRLFHHTSTAAATLAHRDEAAVGTLGPIGDQDSRKVVDVKVNSNAVAAADNAEVAATDAASHKRTVGRKPKPGTLRASSVSSTNDAEACKQIADSSSTTAAGISYTELSSTAAAVAVAALSSVGEGVKETDSLHRVLSRLNLVQLEVSCTFMPF